MLLVVFKQFYDYCCKNGS